MKLIPYYFNDLELIDSTLKNAIKIVDFLASDITIPANAAKVLSANDLNIITPEGYAPIGIVSYYTITNEVFIRTLLPQSEGDRTFLIARNISNTSVTTVFNITVLYAKNELLL